MYGATKWEKIRRLYWLLPVSGIMAPLVIFAIFAIWASFDFGEFGYFLLMAVLAITLFVVAADKRGRQRRAFLLMACAVLFTSAAIFEGGYEFRARVRWTLGSWGDKAEVQAKPLSDDGSCAILSGMVGVLRVQETQMCSSCLILRTLSLWQQEQNNLANSPDYPARSTVSVSWNHIGMR